MKGVINIKNINLYDIKGFKFKVGDRICWNNKIFKKCPFEVDEIKKIDEIKTKFIGIKGIRMWWSWWEIVPTNILKKPMYWIKFYFWYYTRFNKL
nr:MAG TPA: hypothetical protein [Caudoviricetes sp.]